MELSIENHFSSQDQETIHLPCLTHSIKSSNIQKLKSAEAHSKYRAPPQKVYLQDQKPEKQT